MYRKMKRKASCLMGDGLLRSLDEPDKAIAEIWAVEAERRLAAYNVGNLKTVSYEDVFGEEKIEV